MKYFSHIFLCILVFLNAGCGGEGTKIETDPNSLEKYLGANLPRSVHDVNVQIIENSNEGLVTLIAKFEIDRSDLDKLTTEMHLTLSSSADAYVLQLPLISRIAHEWWNPPDLITQWKIKDRYIANENFKQGGKYNISMIWIDGIAYLYKSGPY
jgi:hypothetical protein